MVCGVGGGCWGGGGKKGGGGGGGGGGVSISLHYYVFSKGAGGRKNQRSARVGMHGVIVVPISFQRCRYRYSIPWKTFVAAPLESATRGPGVGVGGGANYPSMTDAELRRAEQRRHGGPQRRNVWVGRMLDGGAFGTRRLHTWVLVDG